MSLSSVFDIIMTMSFAGSVVAAIILLAKGVLKDKLGAVWHYAIWALLLVRLIVPVMPQSSLSIFNLFAGPAGEAGYTWEWEGALPDPGEAPAQPDITVPQGDAGGRTGNGPGPVSLIWLIGAAAILLYVLLANGLYIWKNRRKPRCMDVRILGILQDCVDALHIRKRPELVCDADRKVPALYGVLCPRILADSGVLDTLTDEEVRHIFLHELAHQKRMDNVINWIMTLVSALHWFNPVVWYAGYRMRQDREVACDAYVLNCLKPEEHKKYGETIIRLLQSLSAAHWAPVAVGMAGNRKSTIKRRIKMIKMFKKPSFRWTALAVAVMLVISVVALTNSPASAKTGGETPGTLPEEQTPGETAAPVETPEATPPAAEEDPAAPWQVPAPYDPAVVEADQEAVDNGHSPWQLSPVMVAQVFVSLQLSPEGIVGDYPIAEDDITIVSQDDATAVLSISGDATPIRTVYLQRLVRQDDTGIWTVVGYDPVVE